MRALPFTALVAASALVSLSFAGTAFAGTRADCGNVELLAVGECHFEVSGGCKTKCEPIRFVAACDGRCETSVDVSCTASCRGDCEAACDVDPGEFQCAASCRADCGAQVAMECGDDQECVAYCETACASNCDAQCGVVAPQADCEAQCQACCGGSCETSSEFECSWACTGELQGGCETDCDAPEGALFCDGQYVAVDDLGGCLEYLAANFEIHLSASAEADVRCAAAPGATPPASAPLAWCAALVGLALSRRRRRTS